MGNQQACVWATSKELWDSFLNDPELARAIDSVRSGESEHSIQQSDMPTADQAAQSSPSDGLQGQRIDARLRAYATPITDEILRQSIR